MAGKVVFTRDMIVDAAFSLTRKNGWKHVTARTIAKQLGCSTMPIYSVFQSMEPVEWEVKARAFALMQAYQKRSWSKDPLLDAAVGYVAFARDELNLFRFLFMENQANTMVNGAEGLTDVFTKSFSSMSSIPQAMEGLPFQTSDSFVMRNWIFVHGLASMIGEGVMTLTDEEIKDLLLASGEAFYLLDQKCNQEGKNG